MANSGDNMDYWVSGITSLLPKNTVPEAPVDVKIATQVEPPPGKEEPASESQLNLEKEFLAKEPDNSEKYEYAQLYCKVLETEGLLTDDYSDWNGIYPILMYEKQEVKMTTLNNLNHLKWNEGQYFDVYDLTMELRVTVWGYRGGASMKSVFLGEASFPIKDIKGKTSVEGWFPLAQRGKPAGQVKVHLAYTKNSGKVNVKDFDLLKVVGRGNFGKVMQVRKRDTQRIYAMKVLRKDAVIAADAVKHTLSESSVLRRINHPFIVNLKYAFQTKDKLYMILDYLNGGELFFHLSNVDRFPESRAKMYAAEIVLALGYLHENQIVYRDLKPENLLLDMQGHVCVTDFGLVKEGLPYGQLTYTFCGSPEYLAPEILQAKGYGRAVDWWALGTFLYEMLEGLPPFYDDDISVMNCKILTQPLYFHPDHFTKEAKDLLKGLLERDPNKRLGSSREGAEEIKRHPFFRDIDWDMLYHRKVEPEFKPHLACATDTKYFDEEFTSQTPKDSYVDAKPISESSQLAFNGFSYAAPSMALAGESAKDRRSVRYAKSQQPGGGPYGPGAAQPAGGRAASEGKSRGMNMPRKV
jgi:serine/threonine protein kinase